MRRVLMMASAIFLSMGAAHAQDEENKWTGEGSFSAGISTGNTETTDIGLGLNVSREQGLWIHTVQAQYDFGETDGEETRNRIFLSGQTDRQISDRFFVFGQATYEKDEFSGFENRYFAGIGGGWHIAQSDRLNWTIRAAPGLKVDEVREVITNGVVTTPAETVESFSVLGNSDLSYKFNDNVTLTNTSSAVYAEESTQLVNIIALTASLTDTLSARMSYDVRHDTSPPDGFESTDTTTRISLVYKLGG